MPKPEIRLIAFDLDGTVLNTDKAITPRTRAALDAAQKKGVFLLPATGRTLANMQCCTDLPGRHLALTSNGAAIWDMGAAPAAAVFSRWGENRGAAEGLLPPDAACLAAQPLPRATALAVLDALAPFLPGNLKAFVHGRSVSEAPSYAWEQAHGSAGFHPGPGLTTVVESLPAYAAAHSGEVEKICMFFRDADTLAAARRALAAVPDIEVVQGAPDNLEVTAPGVDKGSGLVLACRVLGIPPENVLAIGDSENDWALLRAAGVSVAMANATPETKALAQYITAADNDHDGVAEAIEAFVPF